LIKGHVRGVITLEELNRTVKEHVLTHKVLRILIGAGKGIRTPEGLRVQLYATGCLL
jgi:hypothetical protein